MEKLSINIKGDEMLCRNNPFLLKGMNEAVNRIVKAVNSREKIVIYGYYDFDGIAAISLLLLVLKFLNADVEYLIPDYIDENKGIDSYYIENHINLLGTGLIVTVGCGCNSVSQVELCKKLGIDIIITDYHKYNKKITNSTVINTNQKNPVYSFDNLSASGIAYKLVEAISTYYKMNCISKYLDLVMLGTISTDFLLTGENSYIIKKGFKQLSNTNNHGLKALLKANNIDIENINLKVLKELTHNISQITLPINKINNARIVVELFTTSKEDRANQIAKYLKNEIYFNMYNK